jgi:hypothetical protein
MFSNHWVIEQAREQRHNTLCEENGDNPATAATAVTLDVCYLRLGLGLTNEGA